MDEPKNFTVYDFDCCDNYGGASFRHWCKLMKHKGIFIGWDNYNYVVYASSDPRAKWQRGCRESCANGDPNPQSETASLIAISRLPEAAQRVALEWVEEAKAIAEEKIKEHKRKKDARKEIESKKREEAYENNIAAPWAAVVQDHR